VDPDQYYGWSDGLQTRGKGELGKDFGSRKLWLGFKKSAEKGTESRGTRKNTQKVSLSRRQTSSQEQ